MHYPQTTRGMQTRAPGLFARVRNVKHTAPATPLGGGHLPSHLSLESVRVPSGVAKRSLPRATGTWRLSLAGLTALSRQGFKGCV